MGGRRCRAAPYRARSPGRAADLSLTRRRSTIAVAVALLAVGAALALRPAGDSTSGRQAAPAFETFDLTGRPVRLVDYRGKAVILNFWASWCVPCRKEFPLLAQLDARPDVAVLGVVFNDTDANARKFMTDQKATWPGLRDDGSIAKAYRVGPGIPASIVVGPDGVVTVRHIGEFTDPSDLVDP